MCSKLLIHIIPTLERPSIAGDCDHARIAGGQSQLARGGKSGRLVAASLAAPEAFWRAAGGSCSLRAFPGLQ